jgi:hypothetical protein
VKIAGRGWNRAGEEAAISRVGKGGKRLSEYSERKQMRGKY